MRPYKYLNFNLTYQVNIVRRKSAVVEFAFTAVSYICQSILLRCYYVDNHCQAYISGEQFKQKNRYHGKYLYYCLTYKYEHHTPMLLYRQTISTRCFSRAMYPSR